MAEAHNEYRDSIGLRAAGVSFEDRQDLLGHVSGRITTHYSAAEVAKLIEVANKACIKQVDSPTLKHLRGSAELGRHKSDTVKFLSVA